MRIAIVGPEESKWTEEQKAAAKKMINEICNNYCIDGITYNFDSTKIILVSGHCPKDGVDIWAEDIADEMRIKKEIFAPEVNQWNDMKLNLHFTSGCSNKKLMGYKSRNIKIAETCDVLYCVVPIRNNRLPYPEWIKTGKNNWCVHCGGYANHPTNGGCWTMKYAKKLGKETHLVVIQ